MTAAALQALAHDTAQETELVRGTTDQVRLRGLTAETFGLPEVVPILIAKLRNLDPAYLADIRGRKTA